MEPRMKLCRGFDLIAREKEKEKKFLLLLGQNYFAK